MKVVFWILVFMVVCTVIAIVEMRIILRSNKASKHLEATRSH